MPGNQADGIGIAITRSKNPRPRRRSKGRVAANHRISNREPIRLEIHATQTKQTIAPHSNREKEQWFFSTSRGGRFSPPAFGSPLCHRVPPPKHRIHPTPILKNSNREAIRLETRATATKQRTEVTSNRENNACFSSRIRRISATRPLSFVAIKLRTDPLFSITYTAF
jgi:hypothetical protein